MADANLFARFAQPVRGVADYLDQYDQQDARRENLAAQRQQNAIQAMALRRQTEADGIATTERNALRQIAQQYGNDEAGYVKALRGSGMPGLMTQADAIEAAGLKRRDTQSQIDHRASENSKRAEEMAKQRREAAVTQVAALNSPEEAMALLKAKVDAKEVPAELAPAFESLIRTDPKWQVKLALAVGDPAKLVETLKPHVQYFDNGKFKVPVDTNSFSNPNPERLTMTTTPGEDLSASTSRANNAASIAQQERASLRSDARARETNSLTREANATVYDPERGVLVNKATGIARPAATFDGAPLGPKDKPLPEGAQKQVLGARNLQDAVANYQEALKGWSKIDMAKPDQRAKMGNAYNNMMLQAKEAYNLGVLNGPDYSILQAVVKDPTKLDAVLVSNGALNQQASELSRIAAGIERTSMEGHGKKYTPRQPESGKSVNWGDLK